MAFGAPTEQFPIEKWRELVALNLTSVYQLTQAVARVAMLPARYGRIINLSSVAGLHGRHPKAGGSIAYASTKGAIISFTRALASEWAASGITVNALAPDVFPTDMTRMMIERSEQAILDRIPMGRLGRLEDIAGVAALLASDASAYITGQIIAVDGGSSSV
jgi:gluconate 5-dehydrogenase